MPETCRHYDSAFTSSTCTFKVGEASCKCPVDGDAEKCPFISGC